MVETRTLKKAMLEISENISNAVNDINDVQVNQLVELLVNGLKDNRRIFVIGAGRSGLVVRAFAMRLMHLGFEVFVVGETITPAVTEKDILIAISGSGRTKLVVESSRIAKTNVGATLVVLTSYPDSPLAQLADLVVEVRGRTKVTEQNDYIQRQIKGEHSPLTPLGTLFESTVSAFLDGLITELMEKTGKEEKDLQERHAVIE
ncbi:MAG: 6-phospho-3-hexuloisomerase [Candidatus Jordarchaeum sp.]|uniref:6-phospho-3-hexuloisomerase n=1 Tax=Candidatus Jordarchaeum sp. TaxID=2823881 RepID=UPI0040495EDC